MPVNITSHIRSHHHGFGNRSLLRYTEKILEELGFSEYTVNILITNDLEIQHLNNTFRHKNIATNVLSFPFSDGLNEDISFLSIKELGDIAISIETAQKEALRFKETLSFRMHWLVTHGVLHLMGYDHERSEKAEQQMFAKEQELLTQFYTYRSHTMPQLAINVDHVSTIRQARGGSEPDPVFAASICELAGASGIVVHLREDRRHIQDRDVYLLRKTIKTKLNLEMGAHPEIIKIALDVVPDMITLVPEKRQELTTEGGLDVVSQKKKLAAVIKKFDKAGIPVSIFVDPDIDQIKASLDIGAKFVEIHTGRYSEARTDDTRDQEFELIAASADAAYQLGLIVNGGHGLDYHNTGRIASLDSIDELSIGHSIISRAVFTGIENAVKDMLKIIQNGAMQLY
jgi:pyridoxine 5-phosphate synthase